MKFYETVPDQPGDDEEQCNIVEFDFDDGYICCGRKMGHQGPHINVFGYEMDQQRCGPAPCQLVGCEDLIDELREALKFYADPSKWETKEAQKDRGEIARKALALGE